MKRVLLPLLVLLFAARAYAQPTDPPQPTTPTPTVVAPTTPAAVVKVPIVCAVRPTVAKSLPTAELTDCKQVSGETVAATGKKLHLRGTDEFAVSAKLDDGTRYELRVTRGGPADYEKPAGEPLPSEIIASMKVLPHIDRLESNGTGMALLFWVFAAATVGGALFVVTRKNLIAAVMGMVGSFLGIAAVYMMLYANFLSVVQMLVYAGAIMVLFVFVVMILNRPEDEPVAPSGRAGQAIGGLAILYLVGRLVFMLMKVKAPAAALLAPLPVNDQLTPCVGDVTGCNDWGSVKAVGTDLFNGGLFPFEAISILLLIAVVGAVAIARPLNAKDDDPEADAAPEGGH